MSSGSDMPASIRQVEIPKSDGRVRPLGVPTVANRIAQMVVKRRLEPLLEPVFHCDSYGYRPGRSAHQALNVARERCWHQDWVLDLDIKGFFDHIDHDLMMRAVRKHTNCRWTLLYIKRCLKANVQMSRGEIIKSASPYHCSSRYILSIFEIPDGPRNRSLVQNLSKPDKCCIKCV